MYIVCLYNRNWINSNNTNIPIIKMKKLKNKI